MRKTRMNERIKQLAEQAGFMEAWFSESGDDCEREIKKFAELLLKECEKSIKSVPTHFEAQDKIIVECLKSIRETFRS